MTKLKGRGGPGRGQGCKKGYRKPEELKRVRMPMTTIKPENHTYLMGLKQQGHSLAKIFDQMIELFRSKK